MGLLYFRVEKEGLSITLMKENALQKRAAITLTVGVIYMMSIGVLYAWSVFSRVIEAQWFWSAAQAGLPFSLVIIHFATGNLIGGKLQAKIPARIVGTLGAVMVGLGLILSGVIGDSPSLVALFFGVLTGLGIGLGYSSFLPTLLKWYHPDKKGFVSGWIIGGFGLTAVYLAPLASFLIDRYGLQAAFILLGVLTLLISLPLAQFLKTPPDGYTPLKPKNTKITAAAAPSVSITPTRMLSTIEFYMLFFMFLCSVSTGQMVIGNITGIAELQTGITDAALLASLVSFMAIVNCGGRILSGVISDKIGWANTLLLIFIIQCANMIGFRFYTSLPVLIVGILFAGFCFGATLGVYPAITVERFGLKNYSANYGIMYMAFGGAGIAAPLIASYFLDFSGNYNTVYIICAIGMAVMILINLLIRKVVKPPTNES